MKILEFLAAIYARLFSRGPLSQVNYGILTLALRARGYGNSFGRGATGELFFIKEVFASTNPELCIDVGANEGRYTRDLLDASSAKVIFLSLFHKLFGSWRKILPSLEKGWSSKIRESAAPDAKDLMRFWDRFNFWDRPYSYGRTFIGGLVPYHYEWNPAVYSKWVLSGYGSDVNVAGGGLRLPPAVKGFYSFYWVGVIVVAALNGAIRSALINICKRFRSSSQQLSRDSKFRLAVLTLAWYDLLGNGSFFGFTLPAVLIFGLLNLLAIAVFAKQKIRYSQAVAPVHVSDLRVDSRGSRP